MFAGHIGAALVIGRIEPRLNLGSFVTAALFLDLLLWLFILLGWESVTIPDSFATTHQPDFIFPYSHGFVAAITWSLLAGLFTYFWCADLQKARLKAALLIGITVFSHWVLDWMVHAPELPLFGEGSTKLGLGLWNSMPMALVAESFIAIVGLSVFLLGVRLPRSKKFWLTAISLFILVFTIAGMTVAPPPPSGTAMAASSLVTIAIVCIVAGWLGRSGNEVKA